MRENTYTREQLCLASTRKRPKGLIQNGTSHSHSDGRRERPAPAQALTSDSRLDRIHAETLAKTELQYYSTFAREFCRSDYNFCAAKMTLARGGKLLALDAEFRVAEAFFKKALAWANQLHGRRRGHLLRDR